jgi:3-deoxy-manno-octulosonate cytidylyltransferase (CMP-KDO synthetase)
VVKVLIRDQNALYFSRQALPYQRGTPPETWLMHTSYYKHIGIYGFGRETLLDITKLPKGQWEQAEQLEQLRWLQAGYEIGVAQTDYTTYGIDTPKDAENVRERYGF